MDDPRVDPTDTSGVQVVVFDRHLCGHVDDQATGIDQEGH
jgi:hypothetical protein